MTKTPPTDPESVVALWLERDLTAAASDGELSPAFGVDEHLDRVVDLLGGGRCPVLVGDSGVGKTAVVHELCRRAAAGTASPVLDGHRFLQISLRRRATALKKPYEEMGEEMSRLVEALARLGPRTVVFIRDIHVAYHFDLENHLYALGFRFAGSVVGEGHQAVLQQMFEYHSELDQYFSLVPVGEPDLERSKAIIGAWAAHHLQSGGVALSPEAIDQALYLTHRFLARTRMPRKAIDLVRELVQSYARDVSADDVIDAFCARHTVPRMLVDPDLVLDPAELETWFESRLLGQAEAVGAVVRMICTVKAGLSDADRPFGAFLFVGPTGVGKTYLARLVAECLFGSRERVVRINLADHQGARATEALFGDPDGHNLTVRRGSLTQRLIGQSFAVLLLDEFEKAARQVHDRFLQLIDEGAFINGAGETVSCRSAVVIATSNAGAEVFRSRSLGFGGHGDLHEVDRELDVRLERTFRLEMLNRFDQIVHFHPLGRDDIRTIAQRELEAVANRAGLRQRRLELEVDEAVLDWLTLHGYDPDFGARFLHRCIERNVTTTIAATLVRDRPQAGSHLALTVRGDRIVARLGPPPPAEFEKRTIVLPEGPSARARRLDREGLLAERERILAAAAPRLAALETEREELSRLLEEMNAPGFWESTDGRRGHLDRYRALEVAVRAHDRLARSIERLQEGHSVGTSQLADTLEDAAAALREWRIREAENTPAAVWLTIGRADPIRSAGDLPRQLVEIERAWCRRLHLDVHLVACEAAGDELTRAILEVEGPGAAGYLEMEAGVHRLCRSQGHDLRVLVEIVPQSDRTVPGARGVTPVKRREGPLGNRVDCRTTVQLADRGLTVELLGDNAASLAHAAADLRGAWSEIPKGEPVVARVYAEDGLGARDPRTGATVARFRDVLRGRLDKLLEAWRARADSEAPGVET